MNVLALLVSLVYLYYSAPKGIDSNVLKNFYVIVPAGLTMGFVVQNALIIFNAATSTGIKA